MSNIDQQFKLRDNSPTSNIPRLEDSQGIGYKFFFK